MYPHFDKPQLFLHSVELLSTLSSFAPPHCMRPLPLPRGRTGAACSSGALWLRGPNDPLVCFTQCLHRIAGRRSPWRSRRMARRGRVGCAFKWRNTYRHPHEEKVPLPLIRLAARGRHISLFRSIALPTTPPTLPRALQVPPVARQPLP